MIDHHAQTVALHDALQRSVPATVRTAARIMYAGAVASVIQIAVVFATANATKTALGHRYPNLSASELTTVARFTVVAEAAAALIAAALFVWIARKCLDAKNWARVTAAVLCAVGILDSILGLTLPGLHAGKSSGDIAASFVVAGIGLVSIGTLWLRSSNAYFGPVRRPRV